MWRLALEKEPLGVRTIIFPGGRFQEPSLELGAGSVSGLESRVNLNLETLKPKRA